MICARFYIKKEDCKNDCRPVKWPIKYPYWCAGEGFIDNCEYFIIIAYADTVDNIKVLWPESYDIDVKEVDKIEFTDRFPKPEWYKE